MMKKIKRKNLMNRLDNYLKINKMKSLKDKIKNQNEYLKKLNWIMLFF